VILQAGRALARIDPRWGARLAQLSIAGLDVLVPAAENPLHWGCYTMAPWAGRVRRCDCHHDGIHHQLPLRLPPHAIHGTTLDREWRVEEERDAGHRATRTADADCAHARYGVELGADWPWPGYARQTIALHEDHLEWVLEVGAHETPFPASLGWHPWFQRKLARGAALEIEFEAESVYVSDDEGIPTGALATPGQGPFDDCFTGVRRPPRLHWPGALRVELRSDCDHWVVYDEPTHAACVEPLSGPPDALNLAPRIVEPGRPLTRRFALHWTVLGEETPA